MPDRCLLLAEHSEEDDHVIWVFFALLPHSLEYIPGTLSRAWLSSLCTNNVCPAGRVLNMTGKFTSNEPTESGNFTLQ